MLTGSYGPREGLARAVQHSPRYFATTNKTRDLIPTCLLDARGPGIRPTLTGPKRRRKHTKYCCCLGHRWGG